MERLSQALSQALPHQPKTTDDSSPTSAPQPESAKARAARRGWRTMTAPECQCDNGRLADGSYCDCWQGKRERSLDEEQAETLRANRERALLNCFKFCDEEIMAYTWDSYPSEGDQEALTQVRAFSEGWDGKRGLALLGGIGAGKTVMMACLFRALIPIVSRLPRAIEMGNCRARFTPMVNIINELRGAINKRNDDGEPSFSDVLLDYRDAYLLCIDDVGVEKLTPFVAEQFYAIINERTFRGLPTFMTSNLDIEEFREHLTPRVFSRLLPKIDILEVAGPDLRELAAEKRMEEASK